MEWVSAGGSNRHKARRIERNRKMNAKAADGVSDVSSALPKPAAAVPPELTVAENKVPAPDTKSLKRPKQPLY